MVASCGAAEQLNGERRRYRSQVLINRLRRTKRVATRNNICSLPVADLPELSLTEMGRQVAVVLYVVAMAAVIVGVDFVRSFLLEIPRASMTVIDDRRAGWALDDLEH